MRKTTLCLWVLFVSILSATVAIAQEDICLEANLPWYLTIRCKFICDYYDCMDSNTVPTSGRCVRAVDQYMHISGDLPPCIDSLGSPNEEPVLNELYCYANTRLLMVTCDDAFDPAIDVKHLVDLTDGRSEYELCLLNMRALYDICLTRVDVECYYSCSKSIEQPCHDEYETTLDNEALTECLSQVEDEIDTCIQERCRNTYFDYPPAWLPPVIE